jgi:MFS family permease
VERRLGGRFNTLWSAATVSFLGDGVALAAFPLLAAHFTGSPLLIAGTQIARGLPFLLVGVFGGVVADRYDRKRLMVGVDLARALLVAGLALWVATSGSAIAVVYFVIFVLACGETLFDPAANGAIPNLVRTNQLERANGRLVASESTAKELVGPAVGALLFTWATWAPFAIDALSFVAAALLVAAIAGSFHTAQTNFLVVTPASSLRDDVASGWNFLRRNVVLRSLAGFGAVSNFGAAAVEATLVLFALRVLDTGAVGFGLLLASGAVGGAVAALVTNRVTARFGPGTVIVGGYIFAGLATFVAALTSNAYVCGVAIGVVFACHAWSDVVSYSLRQELTPDALRGRVFSLFRTALWGVWPFGALAGGLLAEWSLRAPLLMFGGISLVIGLVAPPLVGNRAIKAARREAHVDLTGSLAPMAPALAELAHIEPV